MYRTCLAFRLRLTAPCVLQREDGHWNCATTYLINHRLLITSSKNNKGGVIIHVVLRARTSKAAQGVGSQANVVGGREGAGGGAVLSSTDKVNSGKTGTRLYKYCSMKKMGRAHV